MKEDLFEPLFLRARMLTGIFVGAGTVVVVAAHFAPPPGETYGGWLALFMTAVAMWIGELFFALVRQRHKMCVVNRDHKVDMASARQLAEKVSFLLMKQNIARGTVPEEVRLEPVLHSLAMNYLARRIQTLSDEAVLLQASLGGIANERYQAANQEVNVALKQYWDMNDDLNERYGRNKSRQWKEDLPLDLKK